MSGPPPCTTTGFIPTYLSSTTSRANSSRRAGSVIAAPPYLMTTVRPWNSRMYGSASRRVCTSLTMVTSRAWGSGRWPSRRVLRVDAHVLVAQVGEEDLGLGAVAGQPDHVLDLVAGDRLDEGVGVVGQGRAGGADLDALDGDVERQRRGAGQRRADGLRDAPPVGIAAVQRGLHERRVRHRARGGLDALGVPPAHHDAADALGALAVPDALE